MPLSSDKHIVDEQFRQKLQHHSVQPPSSVWHRVSNHLNHPEEKKSSGSRWLMLLVLLFIAGGGIFIGSKTLTNRSEAGSARINEHTLVKKSADKNISPNTANNEKPVATIVSSVNASAKMNSFSEKNSAGSHSPYQVHRINYPSTVPVSNINMDESLISNDEIPFMLTLISAIDQSKNISPAKKKSLVNKVAAFQKTYPDPRYYIADVSGFYFGFGQTLSSIWIFDNDALKNNSFKYKPTFGSALMVQGGYNFNNKWGLEAAWIFHSDEGQKYQYLPEYTRTTSLEYNRKQIAFNFMHLPVMIRYKVQGWSGFARVPIVVNYSIGMQYGRMLSYRINETKEKVSDSHFFRKNEYALVAALDYDFITHKSVFYTLGIHSSMGSNLFIKDVPEDLEFDNPHNFLIGAHGAINFSLQRIQPGVNNPPVK